MFRLEASVHKSPFLHLIFILAFCLLTTRLKIYEGSHPIRN